MTIDGRSFSAGQAFLLSCKTYWTRVLYPAVREEHRAGVKLEKSVLYQYYCWLERHLQRYKYSGRYGLQPYHAQDRERLEKSLEGSPAEIQSGFQQPDYYTRIDIHQHPGGVWSDPIAGFVYERGARSTTPLAATKHRDLHERLTQAALERCAAPQRVLDMGCGFGKSTRPFYEALGSGKVEGIDLSAPCLRLAARDAKAAARFRQVDATRTDYADASFDLVTSTMLLHELPGESVEATLAETRRLLAPGGVSIHLDFRTEDPFWQFVMYGHGVRNNEPFLEPLIRMDLAEAYRRAGFDEVRIEPFAERAGATDPSNPFWRFPWAAIIARKRA